MNLCGLLSLSMIKCRIKLNKNCMPIWYDLHVIFHKIPLENRTCKLITLYKPIIWIGLNLCLAYRVKKNFLFRNYCWTMCRENDHWIIRKGGVLDEFYSEIKKSSSLVFSFITNDVNHECPQIFLYEKGQESNGFKVFFFFFEALYLQ